VGKYKTRKAARISGCTNDIAWINKCLVEETSLKIIRWALDP
jgi:hypothetical protein